MPEEYYPTPGYYRILMDNPPPNPGPSTLFATNNGIGMQVTAAGSDEDDPLRQSWYVDLNPDGTGVKFFKSEPKIGAPSLGFENVNGINCVFLNLRSINDWTLKYVEEGDPKNNDFNFYIYSSDMKQYLAIQEYGIVSKPGVPQKNEYWHFIGARN